MRRLLLLLALFLTETFAQRTFQSTQFDLSGDLPIEDPSVLAQVEGVPTHHLKNELKPVKIQKPAEIAVVVPPVPQPAAAVQPLAPPLPVAPAVPVAPAAPALPTFAPFTLPTLPPHPSLAPFTFPTHPPLPTLAPFTLPTLPPHPTIAPFTFPTPAPAPAAPAAPGNAPVPQSSDYDEPAQKVEPTTAAAPKAAQPQPQPTAQPQVQVQPQQPQQQQYFTPEYVRYVQQYYPDYFRQHQQYFMTHVLPEAPRPQTPTVQPQQVQPQRFQPQQILPQQPQLRPAVPVQPTLPQQHIAQPQSQIVIRPTATQPLVNGVHTAVGVATVQQATPAPKRFETVAKATPPSRTANWFREATDTKDCKKDLKKVARQFKDKFPNYLQKGGKDAALAELVEKRLVECDEKGSTGHWDKVETLLPKVQLSRSEESECRAGLIQERISCHNLLNFSCQFTNPSYQFKLVPARIIIQEARQAEGGAEKCRKVVRLVKKRLDG